MDASFSTVVIHRAGDSSVRIDVTRILGTTRANTTETALRTLREVAATPTNDLRVHIVDVQPISDIEAK